MAEAGWRVQWEDADGEKSVLLELRSENGKRVGAIALTPSQALHLSNALSGPSGGGELSGGGSVIG